MFPAELTTVFANLLSNAVKAAGNGGSIGARVTVTKQVTVVTIENSGKRVRVSEGERWFKPFESTTAGESATRVASISFLDGLAPEAHYGRTALMAPRGDVPGFSPGSIWATSFARSQLNHSGKPNAAVHEGSMRLLRDTSDQLV